MGLDSGAIHYDMADFVCLRDDLCYCCLVHEALHCDVLSTVIWHDLAALDLRLSCSQLLVCYHCDYQCGMSATSILLGMETL